MSYEEELMEMIDQLMRTCEDGIANQQQLIQQFENYRALVYENLFYEVSPN